MWLQLTSTTEVPSLLISELKRVWEIKDQQTYGTHFDKTGKSKTVPYRGPAGNRNIILM